MLCEEGFKVAFARLRDTPYNYLEIGVFNGDCVAALSVVYPNKRFFGVDPFIEDGCTTQITRVAQHSPIMLQQQTARRNFALAPNAVLFEETSVDFANRLTDQMIHEMQIGMVLIDGSHHYMDVKNDIALAHRLIDVRDGLIMIDDLDIADVRKAYEEFIGAPHDMTRGTFACVEL